MPQSEREPHKILITQPYEKGARIRSTRDLHMRSFIQSLLQYTTIRLRKDMQIETR